MQTILGANGIIARELSKHLPAHTNKIRQASRHPQRVNAEDDLAVSDLLDFGSTEKAVAGSDIVYLLAGLEYKASVWEEQWPKVMRNAIDACKKHNSKLVFFDNVYAYGRVSGPMTEDTPYHPVSRKGEVRAKIARMLMDEVKAGSLNAMIIRSADFYGPGSLLSMTHSTVFERLKAKKGAQWIGDLKTIHSFTYTPDAGKTVAILGNSPDAYNQVWHALTSKERITGEDFVRIACDIAQQPYRVQAMPRWMVRLLGLFIPVLREFVEMMYQFEEDYLFDSTKFERTFNMKATSYKEGIRSCL